MTDSTYSNLIKELKQSWKYLAKIFVITTGSLLGVTFISFLMIPFVYSCCKNTMLYTLALSFPMVGIMAVVVFTVWISTKTSKPSSEDVKK